MRLIFILLVILFMPQLTFSQTYPRDQLLIAGEYFIGNDPGYGNGIQINASYNQPEVYLDFTLPLPQDAILFFRVKSSNNKWSADYPVKYTISNADNAYLISGEYFKGYDPGIGQGVSFEVTPLGDINIPSVNLNRNEWIFLRVQDSYLRWSPTFSIQYKWKEITKGTYYIKYSNGTIGNQKDMTIQNIPSNSPIFVAFSENIPQTSNRDTVFVQVQSEDYFSSGWYKSSGQVTTSVEATLPEKFYLYEPYPNPFNIATTLEFDLPTNQEITIEIYNLLGQRVLKLFDNNEFRAGRHRYYISLNELTSGVYILKFNSNQLKGTKKLILLK